jgi:restriction system protein
VAGLLAHHQARAVKIVCIGTYTKDAERFAQGKPIELMGGGQLLEIIRAVQREPVAQAAQPPRVEPVLTSAPVTSMPGPTCPRCGNALVQRTNRRTGDGFLGCGQLPKCRGTG